MNKDELYEEVEQKSEAYIDSINIYGDVGLSRDGGKNAYKQGALDFAEPREKQIEELANQLEETEKELANYHIKYLFYKKLSKENAKLEEKNKALELYADLADGKVDEVKGQLTRAKGIIKDYIIIVEGDHTTVCSVPEENRCINVLKLNEKAKQFLRHVDRW